MSEFWQKFDKNNDIIYYKNNYGFEKWYKDDKNDKKTKKT